MRKSDTATESMKVTDVREHWSQVVNAVSRRQKRVILEKGGIPVAALLTIDDLERLQRYDARREANFAVLDRIGAAFKDLPDEEVEREVAKAVAEVRAERYGGNDQQTPRSA